MTKQIASNTCATLITALGESDFADKLLDALQVTCLPDHLSLVHLTPERQVSYLFSANKTQKIIPPVLQQLYLSTYYQFDPNLRLLDDLEQESETRIQRLQAQEIKEGGYRQLWHKQMGIVDRVTLAFKADKGLYCLNLFRCDEPFDLGVIDAIHQQSALLKSLALKHSRMTGSLSSFMTRESQIETLITRLSKVNSALSKREKEVSSRILIGMSSEGIALDLGIKTHSVHTYRKRAYARMNISSQNELFALCLTAT
jgi:DNA-binding CsgD family transcriptional regulator